MDESANPLRGKYTNRDDLARSLLDTESKNRSREDVDGISSFWAGLVASFPLGSQTGLPGSKRARVALFLFQ